MAFIGSSSPASDLPNVYKYPDLLTYLTDWLILLNTLAA